MRRSVRSIIRRWRAARLLAVAAALAGTLLAAAGTAASGAAASGAAAAGTAAPAGLATPAPGVPPPLPAGNSFGITLLSWTQLDPTQPASAGRLLDATMTTPAIYQPRGTPLIDPVTVPVTVRIYLPANYQTDPAHPYPVLYLLHGGAGSFSDWSAAGSGELETTLAGTAFNGIVVMPEGGRSGWYSDWYGATAGGFAPQWETFHIEELVPWVDANFNTTGDRSGRAIAGLSMGGLGSLSYAARHTDLFSALGSFSGGTDLTEPGGQQRVSSSMWFYGAAIGDTGPLDPRYLVLGTTAQQMRTVFGVPVGGDWPDRNPIRLVDAYHAYDTKFGLYSGQNAAASEGEHDIGLWNDEFHAALGAANVDHRYCRGEGTHSWSFWRNDLRDFLDYVYGTAPSTCTENPGWSKAP